MFNAAASIELPASSRSEEITKVSCKCDIRAVARQVSGTLAQILKLYQVLCTKGDSVWVHRWGRESMCACACVCMTIRCDDLR